MQSYSILGREQQEIEVYLPSNNLQTHPLRKQLKKFAHNQEKQLFLQNKTIALSFILIFFVAGTILVFFYPSNQPTQSRINHPFAVSKGNKIHGESIKTQEELNPSDIDPSIEGDEQVHELKIKNNKQKWSIIKRIQQKLNEARHHQSLQTEAEETQPKLQPAADEKSIQKYISQQLKQIIQQSRFYDIHHFIPEISIKQSQRLILKAKKTSVEEIDQVRPILEMKNSNQGIHKTISQMTHPSHRPNIIEYWVLAKQTPEQVDTTYFFYELSQQPHNKNFQQAEFYRYNKLYNIGQYGKQLPLCVVLVGRNIANRVERTYDSIRGQNYTNYRIVHVDDHSIDGSVEKILDYLKDKPEFKSRVNLISQRYKRNALYNRNYANTHFCKDGNIIIDMDADDLLIGNQVFQLVNSLYQAGNLYKGQREELWCAYFSNIAKPSDICCPIARLVGQIDPRILQKQLYRSEGEWRTTQLRTYLWSLYNKVDKSDFVDKLMVKQGEFFIGGSDSFMQSAIVEMANPKHMRILDQFNYFYLPSPSKAKFVQVYYSMVSAQTLSPYNPLESLADQPTRNTNFQVNKEKLEEAAKRRKQVIQKRKELTNTITKMYQRDRKIFIEKQKQKKKQKNIK